MNRIVAPALLTLGFVLANVTMGRAIELNPAAVIYKLPEQIPWGNRTPAGNQFANLAGDPEPARSLCPDGQMARW